MRRLIWGIALAAAMTSSAEARDLPLKRLATSDASPVASGKAGELAYLSSPTGLTVRTMGKSTRSYAVPAGCRPQAVGSGVVSLACPAAPVRAVLIEASGAIVPFAVPAASTGVSYDRDRAIGRHWLVEDTSSRPDTLHLLESQVLVEWRTGRTISLGAADPFGKHQYPDLDSAEPARGLCAPLTRVKGYEPFSEVRFANVEQVGRWVLQSGLALQLQRCGQRKAQKFGPDSRVVLGQDALGYLQGRRIVYRDLRSDRRWSTAWPTTRRPFLAMYGRRLVVSTQSSGRYTIYQASPLSTRSR